VPVLLLHCYPFHRQAGYLAQAFPNVCCDIGLAVSTLVCGRSRSSRSRWSSPFARQLYSSDAWGPPELHLLGAVLWRRAMAASSAGGSGGRLDLADAVRVVRMIGGENAARVYGGRRGVPPRRPGTCSSSRRTGARPGPVATGSQCRRRLGRGEGHEVLRAVRASTMRGRARTARAGVGDQHRAGDPSQLRVGQGVLAGGGEEVEGRRDAVGRIRHAIIVRVAGRLEAQPISRSNCARSPVSRA
jgi:hypothetical protein